MKLPACLRLTLTFLTVIGAALAQPAVTPSTPTRDSLVLLDGERFIGQLKCAASNTLIFKSDAAGEITVSTNQVQELRTAQPTSAVSSGAAANHDGSCGTPEKNLAVTDKLAASSAMDAAPNAIPVAETTNVAQKADLGETTIGGPTFLHDWSGTLRGGFGLTESDQRILTYSGGLNLVRQRNLPWLSEGTRTLIDFTAMFGTTSQPGFRVIKTAFYDGSAEQDKFLSPHLFVFASAEIDHNYSQGLQQEEIVGGGIGLVVLRKTNSELELKAPVSYIHQSFYNSDRNRSLPGSPFAETFEATVMNGIAIREHLTITPTWGHAGAFMLIGGASMTLPISKHLGFTLSADDTFLSDAEAGFNKNFFQLSAGITVSLKKQPGRNGM